jgi:hypothetical protein
VLAAAWSLDSSVDGRGFRYHNLVPAAQDWVVNGSALQSGPDYTRAIQMRAGTLHTAVRAARGFRGRTSSAMPAARWRVWHTWCRPVRGQPGFGHSDTIVCCIGYKSGSPALGDRSCWKRQSRLPLECVDQIL